MSILYIAGEYDDGPGYVFEQRIIIPDGPVDTFYKYYIYIYIKY